METKQHEIVDVQLQHGGFVVNNEDDGRFKQDLLLPSRVQAVHLGLNSETNGPRQSTFRSILAPVVRLRTAC
jgi:hypothetical protein